MDLKTLFLKKRSKCNTKSIRTIFQSIFEMVGSTSYVSESGAMIRLFQSEKRLGRYCQPAAKEIHLERLGMYLPKLQNIFV